MLDLFRRKSSSVIMYVMLGAIIAVFAINFGPGSGSCSPGGSVGYAARVNGEVIRQQDFAVLYTRRLDQMRRTYSQSGAELTQDLIERLGLKQQIIDGLIDRELLTQEAKQRGLVAGDAELLEYLKANYGVEGVTVEQYEAWVSGVFRTTVWRFEDDVRDEIVGQKIARVITDTVAVSDGELRFNFRREHDRAMVNFVKFGRSDVAVTPTADEIAVVVAAESEELERRYKSSAFQYRTKKRVKTQQILRRLAADASDADIARSRAFLQELQSQIEKGASFAALAKEHSDDPASNGSRGSDDREAGVMGWFERSQLIKPLADAAFGLKANSFAKEPVRTRLGLHLLQVVEVEEAKSRTFEDVRDDVAAELLRDRAGESAMELAAKEFHARLLGGEKLEDIARADDEEIDPEAATLDTRPLLRSTPWLLRTQQSIPRVGVSDELMKAIFAASLESPVLPDVYVVGRSRFVVVLDKRETPNLNDFDGQREGLRSQALSQKRARVLRDWVKHLRTRAEIELNPALFGQADLPG